MIQETNAIVGSGPQSPRGVYRHKIGCLKGGLFPYTDEVP